MERIKLAHIAPVKHTLKANKQSDIVMCLYHQLDDPRYKGLITLEEKYKILDNSYYEKRDDAVFMSLFNKTDTFVGLLIKAAKTIKANCIVLPDGVIDKKTIARVHANGFDVMVVPTTREELKLAIVSSANLIGISFIHSVNMLTVNTAYRHNIRPVLLKTLKESNEELAQLTGLNVDDILHKRIHLLGLWSYEELIKCVPYTRLIHSCDTSTAVWLGLHGKDATKMNDKFNKKVDFDDETEWNLLCSWNMGCMHGVTKAGKYLAGGVV